MPPRKLPAHKKTKRVSMSLYAADIRDLQAAAELLETSKSKAVGIAVRALLEHSRAAREAASSE